MRYTRFVGIGAASALCCAQSGAQCQETWLESGPAAWVPTGALAVWDRPGGPVLVVGGNTSTVSTGGGLAAWTGQAWEGLAAGVRDGEIRALLQTGDTLVAGGAFVFMGPTLAPFAAELGPTGWRPLPGLTAPVLALAHYQGQLVAGGAYTPTVAGPAALNGTTWTVLGGGVNGSVHSIVADGPDLFVAGAFAAAGGQPIARIARWDGAQWHTMGAGLDAPVWALAMHNGLLYVAGEFTASGGTPLNHVAVWDGSAWSQVGGGLTGAGRAFLSEPGGLLVAEFAQEAPFLTQVRRWTGTAWETAADPVAAGEPFSLGPV